MDRRTFLRTGLVASASLLPISSTFLRAFASHGTPTVGPGPYGPYGDPDLNGIRLPAGFSSRIVAVANVPVAPAPYPWHIFPDGGATFATPDGGWIYTSNSEAQQLGGAGAIRFAADGTVQDAYRILLGTRVNCAGGPTPWGTWLSCEEHSNGLVWECDPRGVVPAAARRALGTFDHEAVGVDPVTRQVYLTEDVRDSGFYRFTPADLDDPLAAGTLEVAEVAPSGGVTWRPVPNPNAPPIRYQVPQTTPFNRGEGAWFDAATRTFYFSTTGDHRLWAYHVQTQSLEVLFDSLATNGSPLRGPDNLTVAPSGDLYVCEDGGNLEVVLLSREGVVAPFLQVTGPAHVASELAGAAFNPAGNRLYFSSQRGFGGGATYEIRGPFRS